MWLVMPDVRPTRTRAQASKNKAHWFFFAFEISRHVEAALLFSPNKQQVSSVLPSYI